MVRGICNVNGPRAIHCHILSKVQLCKDCLVAVAGESVGARSGKTRNRPISGNLLHGWTGRDIEVSTVIEVHSLWRGDRSKGCNNALLRKLTDPVVDCVRDVEIAVEG